MFRHKLGIVTLALLALVACGGSPSAPARPPATVSISSFSATSEIKSYGLAYHFTFQVAETSGRVGFAINNITFRLSPGTDVISDPQQGGHVAAGTSVDPVTLSFSYEPGHPAASQVTITVAFTDDNGTPGVATATAAIGPVLRFTLRGRVTESLSGQRVESVPLFVSDSSTTEQTVQTDSTGHYSVSVALGPVEISILAGGGYDEANMSTFVTGDATYDVQLVPSLVFAVTGSAFHVLVSWQVGTDAVSGLGIATAYTEVYRIKPQAGDQLALSAEIDNPRDSGNVTVSIYKHGQLYQSATANRFPSIASVRGTY